MKKKSLLLVLCFALLFGSMSIKVYAETSANPTYRILPTTAADGTVAFNGGWGRIYQSTNPETESRGVLMIDSNGGKQLFVASTVNLTLNYAYGYYDSNGNPSISGTSTPRLSSHANLNGVRYYYVSYGPDNPVFSNAIAIWEQENYPSVTVETANTATGLYYTYGAGSVGPAEPINWSILKNVEYDTRIAGQGTASVRNIDYISWDNELDAAGNDISECYVEIQAVPGMWEGSTLENLLAQGASALQLGNYSPIILGTVSASSGLYTVSWQRILDSLGLPYDSPAAKLQDEIYIKMGWYYKIRLVSPDGYNGSWQTVYTALSGSAQGSEYVLNSETYNTNIYQYMQDLTQINNQNNINLSFVTNTENNVVTTYNIENPNNGIEPDGGVNLWDLLKALLSGLFQIIETLGNIAASIIDAIGSLATALVDAVADLLSGLLDMIHDLIFPPQEISTDINNQYNTNINNYLENDQPGLNTVHSTVEDLQEAINDIAENHTGSPAATLTWDNVTIDLSPFNAGNVTFIQGGTYDFATAFMNLLQGFGMTYETYQMLVSGAIYISLLVLIGHKVKGFLAKT